MSKRTAPQPNKRRGICAILAAAMLAAWPTGSLADPPPPADGAIRIAAFNASLNRKAPGALVQDFRTSGTQQTAAVVEIIQRVRPHILLVNEIDWDRRGLALDLFADALAAPGDGTEGIAYPHRLAPPSNTGLQSGFDLDRNGEVGGPGDAWGFGFFEGQFALALLSQFPIVEAEARTFRTLPWRAMPDALIPTANGAPYYAPEPWAEFPLSSKTHLDAPVQLPTGARLHLLASHPTPPVFDGPEDSNGKRNHDEIRFWVDYIDGADWITDDAGLPGGLKENAHFIVLGDLNNDPYDGEGLSGAIWSLLNHPRLAPDPAPSSQGGIEAAASQGNLNDSQSGDPALDTADWPDKPGRGPGNLRVDYALPSASLTVTGSGVFWPPPGAPLQRLVKMGKRRASSDHRLVWVDIALPK